MQAVRCTGSGCEGGWLLEQRADGLSEGDTWRCVGGCGVAVPARLAGGPGTGPLDVSGSFRNDWQHAANILRYKVWRTFLPSHVSCPQPVSQTPKEEITRMPVSKSLCKSWSCAAGARVVQHRNSSPQTLENQYCKFCLYNDAGPCGGAAGAK